MCRSTNAVPLAPVGVIMSDSVSHLSTGGKGPSAAAGGQGQGPPAQTVTPRTITTEKPNHDSHEATVEADLCCCRLLFSMIRFWMTIFKS